MVPFSVYVRVTGAAEKTVVIAEKKFTVFPAELCGAGTAIKLCIQGVGAVSNGDHVYVSKGFLTALDKRFYSKELAVMAVEVHFVENSQSLCWERSVVAVNGQLFNRRHAKIQKVGFTGTPKYCCSLLCKELNWSFAIGLVAYDKLAGLLEAAPDRAYCTVTGALRYDKVGGRYSIKVQECQPT